MAGRVNHDAWLVDLDGTLYSALPVRICMFAELSIGGWQVMPTLRRFRSEHERLRNTQREPADPFRVQIERTAVGLGMRPAQVEDVVREWMVKRPGKWLRRFRRSSLLEELVTFRRSGGKLALVSDYPARSKLSALGCDELFDVIVASGEPGGARWLKPHPEGYMTAAERLGVAPHRCLVVGDRLDADGKAAKLAGMEFRLVS